MNLLIFHQLPAINVIFAVIGDGISGYFPFLFGLDFIDNQFKDWAIGFFDQAYSNDVIETCIKNIDMTLLVGCVEINGFAKTNRIRSRVDLFLDACIRRGIEG